MELVLTILTCIFLLLVTYEDLKNKAVPAYFFLLLFVLIVLLALQRRLLQEVWASFLIIAFILLFLIGCLCIYFSIKARRWVNIINTKLGLGDLLFWLAIAPLFTPTGYIIVLLFSLLFSLLVYGIYIWVAAAGQKAVMIPLAGLQALFVSLLLIIHIVFKTAIYDIRI